MILTLSIFVPLALAALVLLVPDRLIALARLFALAGAAIPLCLATVMFVDFGNNSLDDSASRVFQARIADVLNEASANPVDARREKIAKTLARRPALDDPIFDELARTITPSSRTHRDLYFEALEYALAANAPQAERIRHVEYRAWIRSLGVGYFVGVDGLSLPLVWLAALLALAAVLHSRNLVGGVRAHLALLLVLLAGTIGALASLDLFLLLVFWQLALVALFMLLGGWGSTDRAGAALELFLFGEVAHLLIFFVLLTFHTTPSDIQSFNLLTLSSLAQDHGTFSLDFQNLALGTLLFAFAILLPVFPFHVWLAKAIAAAPASIAALISASSLMLGAYGILRLGVGLCPAAARAEWFPVALATLGLFSIVYGALTAMAKPTLSQALAYLSLAPAGYFLIGVGSMTPTSLCGALLVLIVAAALLAFLHLVAGIVRERGGQDDRSTIAQIGAEMPALAVFAALGIAGFAGLPGAGNFVGYLALLVGGWGAEDQALAAGSVAFMPHWVIVLAIIALPLVAAATLPWALLFLRPLTGGAAATSPARRNLSLRELASIVPLFALVLTLGCFPALVFDIAMPAAQALLSVLSGR